MDSGSNYRKPSDINSVAMCIDGDNCVRYYLCFDCSGNAVIRGGSSKFMAILEYAVANGVLHAMTDSGKILDHQMDRSAWIKFREYCGIYEEPAEDKYTSWLEF